jgi:hypothetical protein
MYKKARYPAETMKMNNVAMDIVVIAFAAAVLKVLNVHLFYTGSWLAE